jgi:hypothetical protein
MSTVRFFPSTTGRINTWPMPVNVTRDDRNSDWRKLDINRGHLGLYN